MDSREKFLKAFSFEEDQLPIDFGANPVTGIHCSVVEELRNYFGLEKKPIKIVCPYQMLGLIEDDLGKIMNIDSVPVWSPYNMFGTRQDRWKEWKTGWGQTVLISEGMEITQNENGSYYAYPQGDKNYLPSGYMPESSFFFDATDRSIRINEDLLDPNDNVEEFSIMPQEDIDYLKRTTLLIDSSKWTVGNFGGTAIGDVSLIPAVQLKNPKGIRGVEEWYISTILHQDYLHKVFSFQAEIAIENLKRIASQIRDQIDSVYICGADFGTQNGPLCAPETYRQLHMPYHKKINTWIHENTKWKTIKHSCGAVEPFINFFIEAGFDVLNPVQWTASGMHREFLKKKYGGRIVFWGGGVDTQKTLPFGTPDEVRKEVIDTCRIFGKKGGFVFSSIHNIQAMTPVMNVIAMIDAVREYNLG